MSARAAVLPPSFHRLAWSNLAAQSAEQIKDGRVLFVRDEDALYALAVHTARAFEGFRHIYRGYLEEIARG